jgi:cell division septum initiation protein DivIVA
VAQSDPASLAAPAFGHSLRGYDRNAVDTYVSAADRRIAELSAEVGRLQAALAAADDQIVRLDRPAAEIVASAESRAAAVVDSAEQDQDPQVVLERARAECAVLLTAAQVEADRMVEEARRQAATVDERARQEYAWRRRQVRKEQDLVDQRKQQIVREIKTLSALAAKTADSPAVFEPIEERQAV